MKKWLSILGVCGLVGMSANLTACNKPNNNENGENNKPEPKPKPELPPENSNWKLITDKYIPRDNGWYIVIYESFNIWRIDKIDSTKQWGTEGAIGKSLDILYHWTKTNEPETPAIDSKTGKITNWKG
ncbi:Spiroplasmavirus-related protein [Spiroplasma melliferum]|uniref:Spiroplasmavirus-related protein n=1 Tax=Spiroplasma melliferum TaxID=2134 RepID=A0ABX5U806_SPIME|nr:DUF3688 family protein [Spiroplasma melliferum]QCO23438.1 Spiroplasmavirus-related protein [Spiroplasma melliferum]